MTEMRKGQVRLGPRTWAAIREAYLSGTSGQALADAYGCSLGTIRLRAVKEGWRRCDLPGNEADAAPLPAGGPAGPDEEASPRALADLAMASAMKALRRGKPAEAGAYIRVAEAARRMERADAPRGGEPDGFDPDDPMEDGHLSMEQVYADLQARLDRLAEQRKHLPVWRAPGTVLEEGEAEPSPHPLPVRRPCSLPSSSSW